MTDHLMRVLIAVLVGVVTTTFVLGMFSRFGAAPVADARPINTGLFVGPDGRLAIAIDGEEVCECVRRAKR